MHDILTGTQLDGTAFASGEDRTCSNWTSSGEGSAMVGHHDRFTFQVTVQALWNVGTDFVLVPFAVISYALGDEAGAHEAIAA